MLERYTIFAGRYRVGPRLGVGGMGEVYLAFDERLTRNVALKTLLVSSDDESSYRALLERFEREARTVALLHHTNIVTVHDFGSSDNVPYLVMNHFDGEPIGRWCRTAQPSLAELLRVARTALEALGYAHAHGVLHRDIKPSNILVRGPREAPEVCVIDWGIALPLETPRLTQVGSFVGTFGWADPLVLASSKNAWTPQSDLYSFGVLLYYLLCDVAPIVVPNDASPADRIRLFIANQVVPPEAHNQQLPPALSALIMRLLATASSERTVSVAAALAELDPILAELEEREEARPPLPVSQTASTENPGTRPEVALPRLATVNLEPTSPTRPDHAVASLIVPASALGVMRRRGATKSRRWWVAAASLALVCGATLLRNSPKEMPKAEAATPPLVIPIVSSPEKPPAEAPHPIAAPPPTVHPNKPPVIRHADRVPPLNAPLRATLSSVNNDEPISRGFGTGSASPK